MARKRPPLHVVIAPAAFKETLSARQAAAAIRAGLAGVWPAAKYTLLPVADGGEGTVDALVRGTDGRRVTAVVTGPLGRSVRAAYGLLGDGRTAVIEMAAASGLELVPPARRNPLVTGTWGTGELIRDAVRRGARRILLGIGGSATVDGGTGLARALGVRLLDGRGRPLAGGGGDLERIRAIDASQLAITPGTVEFMIACDVTNPLLGPQGAARVYGPQKGATPARVERLKRGMHNYIGVIERTAGRSMRTMPGAGAAGGIALPLVAWYGARLVRGIDMVLEALDFRARLREADLVVTGEGSLDGQSLFGKAPVGVARAARAAGVPVVVLTGILGAGAERTHAEGVTACFASLPRPMPFDEVRAQAAANLRRAAGEAARAIRLGMGLA
ncbi:MAG: glycerate kinase [Planctomycetota bacterium]